MIKKKRIVLTGPPCSGKSSVFNYMEDLYSGYHFVDEVARNTIKFFSEHEPDKLPWTNRKFFQDYVETKQLQNYLKPNGFDFSTLTFYDRGLLDEVAYRKYFDMEKNTSLHQNCFKHKYDKIFYFPVWEDIYVKDAERIETIEEAKKVDALLRDAYKKFDYELIEVPFSTVKERVKFILDSVE